jgi:hypothetical protein
MTEQPYNLKVRVNMAPDDIVKPKAPEPKYHWGRIILALLVFLALFWMAFKLVSWLLTPAEPAPEVAVESVTADRAVAPEPTPSAIVAEPEIESVAPPEVSEPIVVAKPAETIAPPPAAEQAPVTAAKPEAQAASTSEPAPIVDAPAAIGADQAHTVAEAAVAASPAVADSLLRPGEGGILSAQVERFMLTDGIAKREPQAGIEAIRPDSANNDMVTVYAFSEVSGLQGQTLRYRWSRDGKVVATVKVGVGGNSWRSYSSKFVSSAMQGNWRVELLDASGAVLAFREFEY